MDTKALRQKILDLAIRGKLVPQDPNDEPASVLLERIREEKKQMVKDGKLKPKDIKNDTIIFKGEDNLHYEKFQDGTVKCIEDEIPFEIPSGWCWARLNTIIDVRDGTHDTPKYVDEGVPLFTSKNLSPIGLDYSNVKYISYEDAKSINERSGVDKGDILYAMIGTIGNPTIVDSDIEMSIKNVALFKFSYSQNLSNRYMLYFFSYAQEYMKKDAAGGLQPFVSLTYLRNYLVPLPPVAEQARICAKCDLLAKNLLLIDEDKAELSDTVERAKSKILDLAIRGKLVPQDSNDEPASVLLERIRAEKEELIKQGKLKRDKKESIIFKGDDNSYYEKLSDGSINCINADLPYEIPGSWAWERIRNIFIINPKNTADDNTIVSFVPMTLLDDGYSGNYTYEKKLWKDCKKGFTHFAIGDVCFAKISPCFENRKSAYFKQLSSGIGSGTTELYVLRRYTNDFIAEYLLLFLKSEYFISRGNNTFSGIVGQQRVDKDIMLDTFIPIPPSQEQVRINNILGKLFSELKNIEDSIK